MNHLTPDELIDAVDGTLAPARQAHVEHCVACRDEVAQLSAILRESRQAEVPEPSPLFWDRFSARVHEAVAEQELPRRRWMPEWLRVPVLVPLGALALVLMALAVSIPRGPAHSSLQARLDQSPVDATTPASDSEWATLSEIVGPVDIDRAHEAGIVVKPGDVERAALALTADEQRELVRLLKEEIDKAGP